MAARKSRTARPLIRNKLWIFDFDNTIARLEPEVDWAGGRRELEPMLRELGVPEDLFENYPRGNLPLYDGMRTRLLELAREPQSGFTAARVRSILRRASQMIERYEMVGVDRAAPLEGAGDLLEQLRQRGARLAIVTSNSSRVIRRWFSRHRRARLLDAIIGRDSLLALKPSPEMILRALERCEVPAGASAFVGDADSDYCAAAAAGLEFFGIAFSENLRDKLVAAGARGVFSSPAALGIHLGLIDAAEVASRDDSETRASHRT